MKLVLMSVALCVIAVSAGAQGQVAGGICAPTRPECTVGCPPPGDVMGQANYQQASSHRGTRPPFSSPDPPCVVPAPAAVAIPPALEPLPPPLPPPTPAEMGAGPLIDATPAERRNIAVDDKFIYVLQGDEVVKLDKSDLRVVARTKVAIPNR